MPGIGSRLGLVVGLAVVLTHCSLNNLDDTRGGKKGSGGTDDAGGSGGIVSSGGFPNGGSPDAGADASADAADAAGSGGSAGCASGHKLCAGVCVAKVPENGCDAANCAPCALAHAQNGCVAGLCAISSCNSGFGDCDNVASNGCETSLGSNDHCSSCTDVCSAPIGTTACVSGACKVTACPTNRADCDGLAGNGCEADLTTSASCANCNTQCVTGLPCSQTPSGSYICACSSDAACLNGGTCYLGFCVCGGTACAFNQRCSLAGTCF